MIGSCLTISDLDFLALAAHLDGHGSVISAVDEALQSLGRQIEHKGRLLEGSDRDAFLQHHSDRFLRSTLAKLQRLGAVA